MPNSLPTDPETGEETIVARDYDALDDPDDHRTWIEIAPAAHVEGCGGDPDDYVVWMRGEDTTYRYRVTRDQGGHIMDAMQRALKQATNQKGVQ